MPYPLAKLTSFQSYDVMLHTMSSAVPEEKKWIHSQDKFDFAFCLDSNLGVPWPYNTDLILARVTFVVFFNWRSSWYGRSLPWSMTSQKPYVNSELNALPASVYTLCSSDVAEAAINVCGQLRDVLWRHVEVWWRYGHWFPCDVTCDRTFGLALVCVHMWPTLTKWGHSRWEEHEINEENIT